MSGGRPHRVRRLLRDLSHAETRGDALRRVRRRAGSTVRGLTATRTSTDQRTAAPGPVPDPALALEAQQRSQLHSAQASLADAVARGEPLERAACTSVAALCAALEWGAAWALAEGVGRLPGGATAAALAHGILLHRRRQFARAWTRIRDLDDEALVTFIPVEAVDAALGDGSAGARERALAIGAAGAQLTPEVLVDLAGRFLAVGERDQAAALTAELQNRSTIDLDDRRRQALADIAQWLDPQPASIPVGAVPIAVMDFRTPDHNLTSGNIGDPIQTLSLVGNLVRMTNVQFTGDDGLGEIATELQGRIQPELQLRDQRGSIHLIPVGRDFSSAATVPPGTWMIALGWHMHPLFELRYDFPYHANIRPLFVSFHVNRLEMLTEPARAYLRQHGPVGCRDWTTVFLLLGAGIDAFFSGCITTTVDALFPPRDSVYRGSDLVGAIDVPAKSAGRDARHVRTYSHQSEAYRSMSVTEGLRAASDLLAGYQRDLARAVTRRLHAYLPLTSLGVPAELRIGSMGDVRFAGLTGLTPGDPRLVEIRRGIRDLVAAMLEKILTGADEADVYALWRDLTRERVAEAKARFEAPVAVPPTTIDVPAAVAASRVDIRRFGPHETVDPGTVTDIVLAYDQNLLHPAAVLLESMTSQASGPLRLWILGRGLPAAYQEWLAGAFPSLPMTFLPCDHIGYGGATGRPRRVTGRITISTMDRLLLPAMLEDVHRVIYLDVDTLLLDDVCALARTDLGGFPVAARDSFVSEASEWRRAATRLPEVLASDLRRSMGYRHGYDGAALNAGVLVMDLDRMRRDEFMATSLAMVEEYGLNDQDAMLAYVGPGRRVLEARWNVLPVFEDVPDPSLIHWAGLGKPWELPLTYGQDRWREFATHLRERAGDVPQADSQGPAAPGSLLAPTPVAPLTTVAANVEATITRVREEHLSYLDATSLRSLAGSVAAVERDRIPGLIIEAGTARGGSAIAMATAKSPDRRMRVYDVFGMIPPPGDKDGADVHRRYQTIASGESRGIGGETYYGYREDLLAEVSASFARYGLALDLANVALVQGRFEDTLVIDEPVALAHLDGDWYRSTMTCLTRIVPHLSPGGRIIMDDYDTWSGCRTAVEEYFAGRSGFRFERHARLHIVRV